MSLLDKREKQILADYHWAKENPDLIEKYGGQVVVVHRQKLLGVGNSRKEAIDNARQHPDCPDLEEIAVFSLPVLPKGDSHASTN